MCLKQIGVSVKTKLEIRPASGPVDFQIQPPGSKSISNRALVCAALAAGTSILRGILLSDDTHVMIDSLKKLGLQISLDEDAREITVVGCSGDLPNASAELFVDNSGTTIRFLTAMLGVHGGSYHLTGSPRMHERPIGPLVDALTRLGAHIRAESADGCPPSRSIRTELKMAAARSEAMYPVNMPVD